MESLPKLFISYARAERHRVVHLAHALEEAGHPVWWDDDLQGGHHFAAEISEQLAAADAVVVVWSADAVTSHWVLDEAMAGRDRGCLIPVRFDETEPPLGFRQIQVIDLQEGDADVTAISRAAGHVAGRPPALKPAARRPANAGRRDVRSEKAETGSKPAWVPFAWVGVGLLVWILSTYLH